MNTEKCWAGTQLGQLPYESLWSVMHRFMLRNALGGGFVNRHLKGGRRTNLVSRFAAVSDLSVDTQAEQAALSICRPNLFYTVIRTCPLCIRNGYHSFLHQLSLLQRCPIHNSRLVCLCRNCARPAPEYSCDEPSGLNSACEYCNERWLGDAPTLASMEMQQGNAVHLATAFSAISTYVRRSEAGSELAGYAASGSRNYSDWKWWGGNKDWFAKLQVQGLRPPHHCKVKCRLPVVIVRWRTDRPACEGKSLSRASIGLVYVATLRRLQRWAFMEREVDSTLLADRYFADGKIDLRHWDPRQLAWVLLRDFVEGWRHSLEFMDPSPEQVATRMQEFNSELPVPWRSRLTLRAYLLSLYSSLYQRVVKLRRSRIVTDQSLRQFDSSVVVRPFGERQRRYAIFPAAKGMPMGPFKPLSSVTTHTLNCSSAPEERLACFPSDYASAPFRAKPCRCIKQEASKQQLAVRQRTD